MPSPTLRIEYSIALHTKYLNTMKRWFVLLSALVFGTLANAQTTFVPPPPSAPTVAKSTVVVVGRVVNGTRKDAFVPNAPIKFVRAEAGALGGAPLGVAKSLANGVFQASINVANNDIVFARIDWQGYPYLFPVYDGANQLGANIDSRGQTLRLFDTTTTAPRAMSVMSHQVMVRNDGNHVHVTEEMVVENASDKTFIGDKAQGDITFALSLPKDADEITIDTKSVDAQLVTLGGKNGMKTSYAIAKPILPQLAGGNPRNNALTISYHLPWTREVDLSRRLLYPTKYFAVVRGLNDENNLLIESKQLGEARKPTVAMGSESAGQSIINAVGRPMQAKPTFVSGTTLNITLTRPTKPIIWLFIGLTALLCVFLPGAMWWSRKRNKPNIEYSMPNNSRPMTSPNGKSAEPSSTTSVITRNSLSNGAKTVEANDNDDKTQHSIEQIAALDDAWDDGELSQEDYRSQRAALKEQLKSQLESQTPSR